MKTCPRCLQTKPREAFSRCSRLSDGLQVECKQCYRERRLERIAHTQMVGAPTPTILTCSACIQEKPVSEFHRNKAMPSGRMNECKDCCQDRYFEQQLERCEKQAEYRKRVGRETLNRQWNVWAKRHPDSRRAQDVRRRVRLLLGTPIGTGLTEAEWQQVIGQYKSKCAYCQKSLRQDVHHNHPDRLTQDHVIPLSKGGQHVQSNVVPACKSCNSKKHDRLEQGHFTP